MKNRMSVGRFLALGLVILAVAWAAVFTFAPRQHAAGPAVRPEAPTAGGDLDTGFAPNVSVAGIVYAVAVQTDGKILIGGEFTSVNEVARGNLARLNPDGTLDTAFGDGLAGANSFVYAVALQADGKILIGGSFTSVNGTARGGIARLNPDGTLDDTFGNGLAGTTGSVISIALQADGKVIIGGSFATVNGMARGRIARLNPDGTLDTTFGNGLAGATGVVYALVYTVAVQADGKVLIGGQFTFVNGTARGRIARLNTDGTLDTTFGNGLAGADSFVLAVAVQADGKVLIGGLFTTVNGTARGNLARLNTDGTLDTTFGNGLTVDGGVRTVAVQADGKVLIGGSFFSVNGIPWGSIVRLNPGGTLDTTFRLRADDDVNAITLQADGKVLIGGFFTFVNQKPRDGMARLNTNGTLDNTFGDGRVGSNGVVLAVAVQADGKILIGGFFTKVNGATRGRLARLNPDGTLDATFGNGLAGADENVYAIVVQTDGKILIGGSFVTVNETPRRGVARLNLDGTLDTTFIYGQTGADSNVLVGTDRSVSAVAVQADGKILIGGFFFFVSQILRLNPDGTLDTTFGNGLAGPDSFLNAVALQADGKVIIGGDFTSVNGTARGRLARLNPDGTLDANFGNGLTGADNSVSAVAVQADGKALIGGSFTTVNGTARGRLARLNPDGTLDTAFGNGLAGTDGFGVSDVALQADGKALIGGSFTSVNGTARGGIARLNTDGTLDDTFGNGLAGATGSVSAVALQADGKVLISGGFISVNGVTRLGLARLLPSAPVPGTLQFSASAYSVNENAVAATVNVTRTDNLGAASVNYATGDGTATGGVSCSAGVDYLNTSGTLNWAAGDASAKTFTVTLCNDNVFEGDELISLAVSGANGATLGPPNTATLTINEDDPPNTNPLETHGFFVTQQYADFLSRPPDVPGLVFWTNEITQCGNDQLCVSRRRWQVSLAFFVELEFQQTGAYVYRLYRAAFGNTQPFPNPSGDADAHPYCVQFGCPFRAGHIPSYQRFAADRAHVVGSAQLPSAQLALANDFANRLEFRQRYPLTQTAAQFVDALLANIQAASGVNLTSQRNALIALHDTGGRGAVLYRLADDNVTANPINNRAYIDAEYNRGFVLTQYFGYLRRDPDQPGLNFWLATVNRFPLRNLTGQNAMVCAFVTAQEYQERFSPISPRSNSECPPAP